jgi:uncharacterized GH25 family protein
MKKISALLASVLWLLAAPAFAHQDTPGLAGDHDMSGTVSKLDKTKGTFVLTTAAGPLHLHFPPDVMKDVKNGDKITVHLGFTKDDAAAKK